MLFFTKTHIINLCYGVHNIYIYALYKMVWHALYVVFPTILGAAFHV